MFAIVNIAGKQYHVTEGDRLKVGSLEGDPGKSIKLDTVLLADDGKKVHTGTPSIKNASVSAKILDHGRDRKVLIYKKKRRKGYQRKNGHRQGYTMVEINKISLSAPKKKAAAKKPAKSKEKKDDK